jgi:hypothetical protein
MQLRTLFCDAHFSHDERSVARYKNVHCQVGAIL